MENIDKKENPGIGPAEKELLSKAGIPWEKTKEEAWMEVSAQLGAKIPGQMRARRMSIAQFAIAASFLVLACSTLFMRLYTNTLSTGFNEEKSVKFRDGSIAKLNAESELTYHPLWWNFSRRVTLTGEAYFEVKPEHRHFAVHSENGVTTVLGTRFNVYARNARYEVSCLSGKVKVESRMTDDAVILLSDDRAILNGHGKLDLNRVPEIQKQLPWLQNEWIFTDEPLTNVVRMIENQYSVKILLPIGESHHFTGGFNKSMPVDTVLDLVCTPFGYTFTKKTDIEFEIHPK